MRLFGGIGRALAFVLRVASRTRQIGLARTAASLAFTTALGLVPLATVAFTFAARYPVFQQWLDALQTFLLKHMLPDSAEIVVHTHIRAFIDRATELTGVSIAFTTVTAVLVIDTVESEINAIWGIARKRPLARRLVVFAFGATLGPILVGASIWMTTWLVTQSLAAVPLHATLADLVVKPLPLILSTLALALLYVIAPNRHVPWGHAFIGAIVAALAFEAAKQGFAIYLTQVPTYELVYGALAALPVFLIWIYVCWLIVLTGAAIVAALTLSADSAPPHVSDARSS